MPAKRLALHRLSGCVGGRGLCPMCMRNKVQKLYQAYHKLQPSRHIYLCHLLKNLNPKALSPFPPLPQLPLLSLSTSTMPPLCLSSPTFLDWELMSCEAEEHEMGKASMLRPHGTWHYMKERNLTGTATKTTTSMGQWHDFLFHTICQTPQCMCVKWEGSRSGKNK